MHIDDPRDGERRPCTLTDPRDCAVGSFPPDSVPGQSMDWFYSAYLEAWGYWLPESVAPTIMRYAPLPALLCSSHLALMGLPESVAPTIMRYAPLPALLYPPRPHWAARPS